MTPSFNDIVQNIDFFHIYLPNIQCSFEADEMNDFNFSRPLMFGYFDVLQI